MCVASIGSRSEARTFKHLPVFWRDGGLKDLFSEVAGVLVREQCRTGDDFALCIVSELKFNRETL